MDDLTLNEASGQNSVDMITGSTGAIEECGEIDMNDYDSPEEPGRPNDQLNMMQRISQKRNLDKNQFLRSKPILKEVLKSSEYNTAISSPLNVFKQRAMI